MSVFKNKVLWIPLGLAAALAMASLTLGLIKMSGLGYPVIIHFDQFRGVDFIGAAGDFWGIWLGGLAILALNTFLSAAFSRRERFLVYLFLSANVLIALFMLIFTAVVAAAN
jgi:hypothetical protein